MNKIRIAVVGCTGSVGTSVMDVCRHYGSKFRVAGLAARTDMAGLARLASEFNPPTAVLYDPPHSEGVGFPRGSRLLCGPGALNEMVSSGEVDHVAFASSGTEAIPALLAALKAGKTVSLANKESIVVSGEWVLPLSRPGQIHPLDSEHNAVWQCLAGESPDAVEEVALTASGGPFRTTPLEDLDGVTPEAAVRHPVWSMGKKISVDSATLVNKGIEVIEAMRLFGLALGQVRAYVHPGSSAHGMVRFVDGNVKMLIAPPDMRLAVLRALSYPERLPLSPLGIKPIDMDGLTMSFSAPDRARYPGYYLALEAAKMGGSYPTVLIGADEVAVRAFLERKIPFTGIWKVLSRTIDRFDGSRSGSLDDELEILDWSRKAAETVCTKENRR